MRAALVLLGALTLAGPAIGQAIVTSPAPERVAATVYRDPERGLRPLNLQWLRGYALVSETRRISLPAGESEVRFEGVTAGMVPQSAIVTGLGHAVLEKNRDARLLSPGALLDAYLGERLMLRRTSRATGKVREHEAIVRASEQGVILQTEAGFEALRCTGLNETLLAKSVPPGLSAKPTLSVRVRSPQPVEREITLSYITNNFDWQADYVGEISADGRQLSLFAWMTVANGDATGLENAETQAVAGKLNRDFIWVDPGDARGIELNCWQLGRTHQMPRDEESIVVTGVRQMKRNAATVMEAISAQDIGSLPAPPAAPVMAQQERLGDVRLYRIPINVTVAARSQKQVALLRQPAVKVESLLRMRIHPGSEYEGPLSRLLVTRNRTSEGLGLPLPAGKLALFGTRSGRRILIGEGRIDDHTIGEKVEMSVGDSTGILVRHHAYNGPDGRGGYVVELSSDSSRAETVEIELSSSARVMGAGTLTERDGWKLWRVRLPAGGRKVLRYRS